jgi:Arm DNA-binding domain
MTRTLHRLSPTKVASAKAPGYVADGGNLYLRVALGNKIGDKQPAISRGWIFRFTMAGRTRDVGLGGYPTISPSPKPVRRRHAFAGWLRLE